MLALAIVTVAVMVGSVLALHKVLRKTFKALNPAWLWFSGLPMDGKARTNATWLRPAHTVNAAHPASQAVRWHHWPRLWRAAIRTSTTWTVLLITYGLLVDLAATLTALSIVTFLGLAALTWQAVYFFRNWQHERHYVRPFERSLAARMPDVPVSIEIIRDGDAVESVSVEWKPEAEIGEQEKQHVIDAATARLAIEAPEAMWRLKGRERSVLLLRSDPPPSYLTWDDMAAEIASAKPDELLAGVGKKSQINRVSIESDSPHFGIAMGTGGGKSNLTAFWLVQALRRGDIVLFLDAKYFSHPWAFKDMAAEYGQLPNVAYARRTPQLHDAMVWCSEELERRTDVAERAINAKGQIIGDVGPRIWIVCEELNLAVPRLKRYWADTRDKDKDPKRSPAIDGVADVGFAGRAVKMHLVLIAQMLTAEVTGGGAVRENIGVRALARYTANSWKMQAGDIPMPPSPSVPGRIQLLASGAVHETQVPLIDMEQARELAVGGTVTPLPWNMPGAGVPRPSVPAQRLALPRGSDQGLSLGHEPFVPPPLTLSEALAEGIFGDIALPALRKRVQRAKHPIQPVGQRGTAHEYDIKDLYALARKASNDSQ